MSENIPDNALIVVADGEHALLFRNKAGDGMLKLKAERELYPKDLVDDGPAGNRPPESSPRETDEATFAKQLAEHLYKLAQKGQYDALILAADPQTIGQIRPSLHKSVEQKLIKEVPKTLTNSSVSDIERSLTS